ncbi:hypothetical protein Y1Q_0008933 [Alligator mississippiensis]|uniref:Uncharacterized protein n=1 Tax=Alligator mississippiensis TaxID=8496 RepID=A0A151NK98_ALLMI|nr:hypothetical protein Y1Q_0008933 [Alligator mississippiensis]
MLHSNCCIDFYHCYKLNSYLRKVFLYCPGAKNNSDASGSLCLLQEEGDNIRLRGCSGNIRRRDRRANWAVIPGAGRPEETRPNEDATLLHSHSKLKDAEKY